MIDEFEIIDCGNIELFDMEFTKDNLLLALDEFDFRSERLLPNEYKLIKRLIDEHFELLKCFKEMYDQNDIDAMQFEINLLQIKNTRLEKELERYKTMLKTFK